MARRESEPIERIHVHLFASDIEFLKELYGTGANIGFNKAVRLIVRNAVKQITQARNEIIGQSNFRLSEAEIEEIVKDANLTVE